MDVILEIADRFVFDRFWSTVLPAATSSTAHNSTATYSSIREGATLFPKQKWAWEPATSYFSFPPTEQAWMSSWSRDRTERQFIELFLIVWYVD